MLVQVILNIFPKNNYVNRRLSDLVVRGPSANDADGLSGVSLEPRIDIKSDSQLACIMPPLREAVKKMCEFFRT